MENKVNVSRVHFSFIEVTVILMFKCILLQQQTVLLSVLCSREELAIFRKLVIILN